MRKQHTYRPKIVLVGGGHAHLHALRRTAGLTRSGFDVTLVDPSPYLYYSGMATGVVSGIYAPEEDRIDIRRLVEEGGGSFVKRRARALRPEARTLILDDGSNVPYDAVSFCTGSRIPEGRVPDNDDVIPVKPVENAAEVNRRLRHSRSAKGLMSLLVVGGGAAGCEVAANALALLGGPGTGGGVTVVEKGGSLLAGSPRAASRSMEAYLRGRGTNVLTDSEVVSYGGGAARLADGRELRYDLAVLAVGVEANDDVFRGSGLPVGTGGGLWVDGALRSVADARVFGGGDGVSFRGDGLPKLGVFAIRQGPVLCHNLQAVLRGEPLRRYEPQRRYLYILNLGDGTGLASYGLLVWRGRLAWLLKKHIDRGFISEYDGNP